MCTYMHLATSGDFSEFRIAYHKAGNVHAESCCSMYSKLVAEAMDRGENAAPGSIMHPAVLACLLSPQDLPLLP